ncbi:MAG TPA: toll/interleukin-1 receptor domain-containing protein [Opitutaceae bacterium]|nr:toll/interleukin-1 receptor domain-containing protein [Opitutaceae bacterium]
MSREWTFHEADGQPVGKVIPKIAYDLEANARYWYFYIPAEFNLFEALSSIFASEELKLCRMAPEGDGFEMAQGFWDCMPQMSTATLHFTRRVHIYVDHELNASDRRSIAAQVDKQGFHLSVRDREYARKRSAVEKPLAFISHDSRDKDTFVRALAHELLKIHCPVWYDEFSLKVGDSLRASIEKGLKEAQKCVVILSPNFFSNKGWGLAEFDSIFTREIMEKNNVILPVWLNVDTKAVYDYSPRLADKVGLNASHGIEEVARKLAGVIKSAV